MCHQLICRCLLVITSLFLISVQGVTATEMSSTDITTDIVPMAKVSVNKATKDQLATLKGIGNKKAQAIIDYRSANGDFVELDELIHVKGIGRDTLGKIKPFIKL